MATSWTSSQNGIVLAYPSRNTGARPYLFATGNGGRTWRSLPAPPVPFPADNDQPDATWAGGVIAVTDGTRVVVTRDEGHHWSAMRLAGASGAIFVDRLAVANGRLFALLQAQSGGTESETVYSGLVTSGALRPVRGLTVKGPLVYGDITTTGILQVDLGVNYTTERYWYSRDGVRFAAAPLPCPATTSAQLGGERASRVTALCSGSPSDVTAGENDKQVWIAPRPGARFQASGPVFVSPNGQGFAAASARVMAVVTTFTLSVTVNAGHTWADKVTEPNGAFWSDLSFQTATTGVAVTTTVSNALKTVGFVYRTTDGGRTWHALSLP